MSPPHRSKFMKYSSYYKSVNNNNNLLNKANPIVVNSDNAIVDGYCTYIILSKSGQKTISCIKTNHDEKLVKTIIAIHKGKKVSTKKYAWRVKNIPIIPQKVLWAQNSDGNYSPIIPQKIEMLPIEAASSFSWLKIHRNHKYKR